MMLLQMAMAMGLIAANTNSADFQMPCRYPNSLRNANIPIAPAKKATEIIHAAVISRGSDSVGYLFMLRDGHAWYEDWQAGMPQLRPSAQDARLVLRTFGINKFQHLSVGTLYPLPDVSLLQLMRAGLEVQSCY